MISSVVQVSVERKCILIVKSRMMFDNLVVFVNAGFWSFGGFFWL